MYKKGKGYLYCQKLHYTEYFIENIVKPNLDADLVKTQNDTWLDAESGEIFEIQVWNSDIYIVAI